MDLVSQFPAENESVGVAMDNDKFHLLLDVLKILEKHEDPGVIESALELVESYNESLSQEQKVEVLKEVLHIKSRTIESQREQRFQEEWRKVQMRELMHIDYL